MTKCELIADSVAKAKQFLSDIKELGRKVEAVQIEVAELAIKVCDIKHGGFSANLYTIKDFAKDIGMHSKTLQNWVAAYRNVVPYLGSESPKTKEDWAAIRKTNRHIDDGTEKNEIKSIFDKYVNNEKPFIGEFRNAIASGRNLKHLMKNRELELVEDSKWLELMEILDHCSDKINEYLTHKRNSRATWK